MCKEKKSLALERKLNNISGIEEIVTMQIEISDSAKLFLGKKLTFFGFKNRKPRIIEVAKTCHGAEFRLVFELIQPEDVAVLARDLVLYVPQNLLAEYSGFKIELESFFFAPRLVIKPYKQSFACGCTAKCPKHKINNEDKLNIEER